MAMNRAALLMLGALLLAGCGERTPHAAVPATANPAAASTSPPTSAQSTAPPAQPVMPAPAAAAYSLDPKGAPVGSRSTEAPVLVDVRTAEHEGFDRIVFEFESDGLPQWRASWVEIPITDCGAGQVVPVRQLVAAGAKADIRDKAGKTPGEYAPPDRKAAIEAALAGQ